MVARPICQHNGICSDACLVAYDLRVRSPSEELRRRYLASVASDYRVWKDTGVHRDTLRRLRTGRAISMHAFDILAVYLGLELKPVRKRR